MDFFIFLTGQIFSLQFYPSDFVIIPKMSFNSMAIAAAVFVVHLCVRHILNFLGISRRQSVTVEIYGVQREPLFFGGFTAYDLFSD
jgi:hypothetical protein